VRPAVGPLRQGIETSTLSEIGYSVDVDATVRALLDRGRQTNPIAALADHLATVFGSITAEPIGHFDEQRFRDWAAGTAAALSLPPREGNLRFDGTRITPVDPAPGFVVSADEIQRLVRDALLHSTSLTIEVTANTAKPRTNHEAVMDVLVRARRDLSGPVTLTRGSRAVELTAQDLAAVFVVRPVERGDEVILDLAVDPTKLSELKTKEAAAIQTQPVSARFRVSGGKVRIAPSRNGFGFDANLAAAQIIRLAGSTARRAPLQGQVLAPEFTTEDARALHITRLVSSFTTYHPCCEARVTNIHRTADLLDGTIVRPGETFSLNGTVGERTSRKGFVIAPGISGGTIVPQLGGGISQFTTTMFNAAWFGGYQIVEHQTHSFYFSRYPPGREATLSWPSPDLKFKDDSDAGILINTYYTDQSITVSFYGNTSVKVKTVMGEPTNVTQPRTQCEVSPDLLAGAVDVKQAGSTGFDVVDKRILHYPDGTVRTEVYPTHYLPEPHIVEQRSCASPSPSPSPSPSASPTR